MPNCIQLINKVTQEAEAFPRIDEKLCAYLNVPCDPIRFYLGWYDRFAFGLATGDDWAKLKENYPSPEDLKIINWLQEHYDYQAWYSPIR